MSKTINEKIDHLFSKINWADSALDAEAIQIMNELKSDIKTAIDKPAKINRCECSVCDPTEIKICVNCDGYVE